MLGAPPAAGSVGSAGVAAPPLEDIGLPKSAPPLPPIAFGASIIMGAPIIAGGCRDPGFFAPESPSLAAHAASSAAPQISRAIGRNRSRPSPRQRSGRIHHRPRSRAVADRGI